MWECAATDRATFQKAMQCTRCRFGIRRHRVSRQFCVRLTESRIARRAAPALNAPLTEVSKSLAGLVLALEAGHWVSPLAFCRETSQNTFGSEAWVTPRFGLAPPPVSAGSGALNQLLRLTAEVGSWPSPFYLKRSASLAR